MKITPLQQYIFLGGITFVAIVFLFYQFLLKPINAQIVQLNSDLQQKRQDLDDAKKIIAKYAEFKKRADSVNRELEWIQNRIPKVIDKTSLLESINFIQSRTGIVLTSFQMNGQTNVRDSYVEVPVNLKFNTSFQGLINVLYQASVSPLLMTANGIVLTPMVDANHPDETLSVQMFLNGVQAK